MLEEAAVRRQKYQALKDQGLDPYTKVSHRSHMVGEVLSEFDELSTSSAEIVLAGRLFTIRVHGGMMFADLHDETGKIQLALKQDDIGEESFARFRDCLDPGDIVEAKGALFTTKRGEKSLEVKSWTVLAKALLPMPEKWHGLKDVELRYRERELDLLSNPEVRARFVTRAKLVSAMRQFLDQRGFLEIETPVLHPIPGGANAKPFVTHHNALDVDLYLRIAPELYLKRCLVGGFEKIYEVARCFRNEGIDYAHNPEFTQIELYWAYAQKETFFGLMEQLLSHMMQSALGTTKVMHEDGEIEFAAPYPRITFRQAIIDACGVDIDEHTTPKSLVNAVQRAGLSVDFGSCIGMGEYYDELYKKTARAGIKQPTWVTDYPIETKPLANRHPDDPTKSATAQLVVRGAEVINAYYHELHDPIDQRARFDEQQSLKEQGSEEAQHMDESFLRALEHGMPPAGGFGMGIDRLVAFLTGSHNLKEVILFPTLRPLTESSDEVTE